MFEIVGYGLFLADHARDPRIGRWRRSDDFNSWHVCTSRLRFSAAGSWPHLILNQLVNFSSRLDAVKQRGTAAGYRVATIKRRGNLNSTLPSNRGL